VGPNLEEKSARQELGIDKNFVAMAEAADEAMDGKVDDLGGPE
jgi:hypothetical protein